MCVLTQIFGLILSLSILVILHELGHFTLAKLFKVRVEKFYLFFDPWFSIFKIKRGDTEYGIGWLPLGGYVKISGMIDESMDKEQLKQEPQPWEFRSKPAWQRFLIMIGGVVVNFILALFIYSMILYAWGKDYLPVNNVKYGLHFHEVAIKAGFQNGDNILKIDNNVIENIDDISGYIIKGKIKEVTVDRKGQNVNITLPADFTEQLIKAKVQKIVLDPQFPFIIEKVMDGNPAAKAGLMHGDRIVAINNIQTPYWQDFTEKVDSFKGKEVEITYLRNGVEQKHKLTLTEDAKIGVQPVNPIKLLEFKKKEYGLLSAIPAGIGLGVETLTKYVTGLKYLFTKAGAKQVGGFGAIGGLFPTSWDWESFWSLTALLSVVLAFMNILPIPALDGGHALFLTYEIITGRKPSDKFMEYAQITGMVILFSLLLFANGNDLYKWLSKYF